MINGKPIAQQAQRFVARLWRRPDPARDPGDLQVAVASALREWQAAQSYFNAVSEHELVDHAIYNLEAARRKYVYLLRQARPSRAGWEEVGS